MQASEFQALFPKCHELGLDMVQGLGFDVDQVQGKLGTHFDTFMQGVKTVFCCGHRTWPDTHTEELKRGAEVHCVYAGDLEKFLEAYV